MQVYGLAINTGITWGVTVITFISTEIIPLEEDGLKGMLEDQNWRWVFAFSIFLNVFSIVVVTLIYPNPSLKDYLKTLNEE